MWLQCEQLAAGVEVRRQHLWRWGWQWGGAVEARCSCWAEGTQGSLETSSASMVSDGVLAGRFMFYENM